MAKVFKDLGKDAKDVLSQDFHSGNNLTIIAQPICPNGITIKTTLKRLFKKDPKTKTTKEAVELLFEPKYEWKAQNLEFSGKFSSARDFSGGFLTKDLVAKGSKFEFNLSRSDKDGPSAKMIPSFKNDSVSAQASIAYPLAHKNNQPIKLISELVVHYPKTVLWGVNFLIDLEPGQAKVKTEGSLVSNPSHDSQVAGRVAYVHNEEALVWGLSFFHKLSDTSKWAVDYELDASKGPSVQVGGEHKYGTNTVKGRAQIKVTETGAPEYRIALSGKQHVSKYFTLTLSADFNVRQFLGESIGDHHSFGAELKFSE